MKIIKKKLTVNTYTVLFLFFVLVVLAAVIFLVNFIPSRKKTPVQNELDLETRSYHIVVLGSYENASFLKSVYNGANKFSEYYNSVIEYYVPESQAEDVSLQSLLDYSGYVNADGIIAYIDSLDEEITVPSRIDGTKIPLITTGFFSPNFPQVSFIGNNYWELGKKIAEETIDYFLEDIGGVAYVISSEATASPYYSNLMTSLQSALIDHNEIESFVIDKIDSDIKLFQKTLIDDLEQNKDVLLICLTAEDTIRTSQTLQEINLVDEGIGFIGFGNSETCQLYMEKGIITELISVDPEKIGEMAINELFEYRNKGYANSYITPDIQISTRSW